jgi:hypothetical protein
MRYCVSAILLGLSLAIVGCQSGQVAGRPQPVRLSSMPSEAVPYLIRWDDWLAERRRRIAAGEDASDEAIMADDAFLARHRVKGGLLTGPPSDPVVAKYPSYSYIAVFQRNGEVVMSDRFTPPAEVSVRLPDGDDQ